MTTRVEISTRKMLIIKFATITNEHIVSNTTSIHFSKMFIPPSKQNFCVLTTLKFSGRLKHKITSLFR